MTEASSILAMVGERLGVSIIPALAAPDPPASVVLRPLRPRAERRLSLAHPTGRTLSPACRAVLTEATAWTARRRRARAAQGARVA